MAGRKPGYLIDEKNLGRYASFRETFMKVYIANLGERNAHWPICKAEGVLTLGP
jgi:hypothetical protein